jgi:hypothetical protein
MMTARTYVILVGCTSAAAVMAVVAVCLCNQVAWSTPHRPKQVAPQAVWRPTPSESSVALAPHGDWIHCSGEGETAHCVLTDAQGKPEYEGAFQTLPDPRPISPSELHPVASDLLSPWMWSPHLGKMVPVIHLADGAVLAPRESAGDLRSYVARLERFTQSLRPVPVYAAEDQPRASAPASDVASRSQPKPSR